VWVNTLLEGKYKDTNALFESPVNFDFNVCSKDAGYWAKLIVDSLLLQ
jgi:hypothetical protein